MNEAKYPVFIVWSAEDDAFLAVAPQLDGCVAHGDTREEALSNLDDCVIEWLESAKQLGWTIPEEETNEDYERATLEKAQQAQQMFQNAVVETVQNVLKDILPQMAAKGQIPLLPRGRFSTQHSGLFEFASGKR